MSFTDDMFEEFGTIIYQFLKLKKQFKENLYRFAYSTFKFQFQYFYP